jgi:hypothetical protein
MHGGESRTLGGWRPPSTLRPSGRQPPRSGLSVRPGRRTRRGSSDPALSSCSLALQASPRDTRSSPANPLRQRPTFSGVSSRRKRLGVPAAGTSGLPFLEFVRSAASGLGAGIEVSHHVSPFAALLHYDDVACLRDHALEFRLLVARNHEEPLASRANVLISRQGKLHNPGCSRPHRTHRGG